MTRYLCCGDLHLGSSPDFGNAPGERLADQRGVWLALCEQAVEHNVDAVLFAGDAYHRRRPTPAEMVAWRDGLDVLDEEGIPIIAIAGNHDVSTTDSPTGPGVLDGYRGFVCHRAPRVLTAPGAVAVPPSYFGSGERGEVAVLPWVPSARWIASHGRGDPQAFTDALLSTLAGLRAQCETRDPVLMLHWSVSGAETPTGARTDDFREPVLPASELAGMGWGAIVCGHIHKAQRLGSAFFYTGSPLVVDFGEWRSRHGYWILEAGVGAEFHDLGADRPFRAVDWDVRQGLEGRVVDGADYSGAVVRIRLRCTEEQARVIDLGGVRDQFLAMGAHRVYQITPIVDREQRAQQPVDETAEPLDAMRSWCEARGVEDAEPLLERTAGYLSEVAG